MNKESGVLEEILKAREKRARTQRELINIYRTTLISFTLAHPLNKTVTAVSPIKLFFAT
jgi:holo-ACP synthase